MDGSGQDNDAARAGEQPRYPPVDTQVHAPLGHALFDSVQARAARLNDIFRYAPDHGHNYEDMIRNGRLASRRGFGGHAYRGGEATRTWAVASRDTDGSGQNNGAAAGEQPHPLPVSAGTPVVLEPSSYEREFFDAFARHDYRYLIAFRVGGSRHGDMNEYGGDAYRGGGFGAVPASDDEIARLEKATVGDTREAECVVCMESFQEGEEIRKMPCSHGFHETCIFKWLRVSRLCPHCRFALPADDKWL